MQRGGNRGGGKKKTPRDPVSMEEERRRMRYPKDGEVMGVVLGLMGGSRMKVACKDGKERMCRIPGKLRNRVWVREGDVVIVKPWEIEGEKKGDVIWRYWPVQARILKEEGHV
ncbi:translation initiation factor eIF-1A [Candidatus Micrarchaeota archaeon]|nr:translation initiation factor eIF-1A [Candidatus Micrarchaeota archaeon]MBU1165996.1 translation initiation factor eIF-1A [Candidatus Micrarchaeota archaeon]MBU1886784.1 translation initiation factor eIF-1A [Candidatus Micrarchaeota archaeon]